MVQEAGLNEREIFNEVNHLFAAHKAIALILSFTLLELGRDAQRNPDTSVSERVRLELQSRLADTGRNFFVREDLNKLPETMALWKEVLRLHPVAIAVLRETGEPLQHIV